MRENIFSFFKDAAQRHHINYINCVEDPDKAAFGFMRTQFLNNNKFHKNSYEHYLVSLGSEGDALRFEKLLPEILDRAGLSLYKCIYYRDGADVHVVFNVVDMNGKKFGWLEEFSFRLASR